MDGWMNDRPEDKNGRSKAPTTTKRAPPTPQRWLWWINKQSSEILFQLESLNSYWNRFLFVGRTEFFLKERWICREILIVIFTWVGSVEWENYCDRKLSLLPFKSMRNLWGILSSDSPERAPSSWWRSPPGILLLKMIALSLFTLVLIDGRSLRCFWFKK